MNPSIKIGSVDSPFFKNYINLQIRPQCETTERSKDHMKMTLFTLSNDTFLKVLSVDV